MNRFAAIAALLSPSLYAADAAATNTPWLAGGVESARGIISQWETHSQNVIKELSFFHASLPEITRDTSLPESPNGDMVIVCDRALLFNAESSRMVYVGNVRMRESRLTLHARDNLYVRMQDATLDKSKEKGAQKVKDKPAVPAAKTAAPAKSRPTAAPAPAHAAQPQKAEAPLLPGHIETGSAVVDTQNNLIILYSPAGAGPIEITRGSDIVRVSPTADTPARLLADPDGNVLLEGRDIYLCTKDRDGKLAELRVPNSTVYYHAASHSLTIPGTCYLSHPDGSLECTEKLCLFLQAEKTTTGKSEFLSQFSGLRISGIRSATAAGNVRAATRGVNGTEAGCACGDRLHYDGLTGDCSIEGADCRLEYGRNNKLFANSGIHLLPSGDIELRGSRIHGTYERPAQQQGTAPICGSFETAGDVIFRAETGEITTTGLRAKDAESAFCCSGAVRLQLARNAEKEITRKPGMPNLAITAYGDISRVQAEGNISAQRYIGGKLTNELMGDKLTADLTTGEATLLGSAELPAIVSHEQSRMEALPGAETEAKLDILPNGDLRMTGATITTTMQGKDGLTTATCRDYMNLYRDDNRIETGSGVKLTSPSAILTTNGPLEARLEPSANPEPPTGRYPQHRFNYVGIRTADTAQGGTIRTSRGSMQCAGPIHIEMNPNGDMRGEYAGLRRATAKDDVMLLTRTSDNRLLHATGDLMTIDAATGMKKLTGRRVTLGDEKNTHVVSGKGAAVYVDAKNNARISGEKHTTVATGLNEQADKRKQEQQKKKELKEQKN